MSPDARKLLNWQYAGCPLQSDAERFGPFEDLIRLWRGRIGAGRSLPSRGDFAVEDFRTWLGRIFIARIERDPFAVRFVLWGTQLAQWWKVDYTNKLLGAESSHPDLWNMVELKYFEAMDRAPFIGVACGYLDQHDQSHIKVLGVDLPLSDGAGLSHVVSVHMQIGLKDTVSSVMPDCPIAEHY